MLWAGLVDSGPRLRCGAVRRRPAEEIETARASPSNSRKRAVTILNQTSTNRCSFHRAAVSPEPGAASWRHSRSDEPTSAAQGGHDRDRPTEVRRRPAHRELVRDARARTRTAPRDRDYRARGRAVVPGPGRRSVPVSELLQRVRRPRPQETGRNLGLHARAGDEDRTRVLSLGSRFGHISDQLKHGKDAGQRAFCLTAADRH